MHDILQKFSFFLCPEDVISHLIIERLAPAGCLIATSLFHLSVRVHFLDTQHYIKDDDDDGNMLSRIIIDLDAHTGIVF